MTGIRTTNIDTVVSISDQVLVNRGGSTALQPTSDLATQIAAVVATEEAIQNAAGVLVATAVSEEAAIRAAADDGLTDQVTAFGARANLDIAAKYARSGYDNVVVGNNSRILSALRRRDDTTIIGSRGVESSGHQVYDDPKFRRSGIVGAVVDKAWRIIRGQNPSVDREIIGAGGIETRFQSWNGLNPKSRSRSGFTSAKVDREHKLHEGVDAEGNPYLAGTRVLTPQDIAQDYDVFVAADGADQHIYSHHRVTGELLQLSEAGTINTSPRIERDGTVSWDKLGSSYAVTRMWSPVSVADPHRVFPMREILLLGDSLVEQDYGIALAALTGIPVRNMGKSGTTSRNAAVRVGALPMRLASATGKIPASGSVQVSSPDGLGAVSLFADGSVSNIPGSWGGIAGTLSWDNSTGQMTFARTSSGSAISARGEIAFVPTITDSLTTAVINTPLERICVFHIGRNNLSEPYRIFFDFKACVAAIPTRVKQCVCILPMPTKTEVLGNQPAYLNYLLLRELMLAEFPHNTIDLLAVMIENASSSTDDLAAVAAGYPPPSLMQPDEIHPSAAGRTVIATAIYNFHIAKGWL